MSNTRKVQETVSRPEYYPQPKSVPYFPGLGTSDPAIHVLEYFARLWGHKPVWAQRRDGDIPKTKITSLGWPFSPEVLKARMEGW